MKAKTFLATLEFLGVQSSFSRPRVSNDNAYSESLFRTMKYDGPTLPANGFKTLKQAREWISEFSHWYNNIHMHSSLKFVTPNDRHNGDDKAILENRKKVYEEAKKNNPNRWSGKTRNWELEETVALNPTSDEEHKLIRNQSK